MRALKITSFLPALVAMGVACAVFAANIGPDDAQVSFTGAPGTIATDAVTPAVAFDPVNQRYLVVWSADESDGDFRIFGKLLAGAAGTPVSPTFKISEGGVGNTDHRQPAVAYSATEQRFLVVWSTDIGNPGAFEIHGQVVDSDGVLVGASHRYSDMGANDMDPRFDAVTPDVAWYEAMGRFIVVWAADDDTGGMVDGTFEIYGQLAFDNSGAEVGLNDFRISYAGDPGYDVLEPALAVVPGGDRWIVVFEADVAVDGMNNPEIWGYGCHGDVPDPAGFLLSIMGGGIGDAFSARNPDVAWVPSSGELICVWDGVEGAGFPRAIYGQRFLPDGSTSGVMIPFSAGAIPIIGDLRESIEPSIVVDPVTDLWFVAWRGDMDDGLTHFDHEIWARRFDDVGNPVDAAGYTISGMDPSLGPVAGAGAPAVAVNGHHGYKLIVWSGDLDTTPDGEHEIFAQAWSDNSASAIDETPGAKAFALHGAAPNPFNPSTTIAFDLPLPSTVSLRVYDPSGRLVRTLLAGSPGQAGRNEVVWNGRDDRGRTAASGVYLFKLVTPTYQDVGRMTLMK